MLLQSAGGRAGAVMSCKSRRKVQQAGAGTRGKIMGRCQGTALRHATTLLREAMVQHFVRSSARCVLPSPCFGQRVCGCALACMLVRGGTVAGAAALKLATMGLSQRQSLHVLPLESRATHASVSVPRACKKRRGIPRNPVRPRLRAALVGGAAQQVGCDGPLQGPSLQTCCMCRTPTHLGARCRT